MPTKGAAKTHEAKLVGSDLWIGNLAGIGDVIFDPDVQEDGDENVVLFDTQLKVFCRWDKKAAREIASTITDSSQAEKLIDQYLHFKSTAWERSLHSPDHKRVSNQHLAKRSKRGSSTRTLEIGGNRYVWEVDGWYEYPGFVKAPETVTDKLNELSELSFLEEDLLIESVGELLHRSRVAREARQFKRSEKIAYRILELSPGNEMALAVLCASLRVQGRPREALEQTTVPGGCKLASLLTSRAAAYCDVEEWEKAKIEIARSLAIEESDHAFAVVLRIKSARPNLYQ